MHSINFVTTLPLHESENLNNVMKMGFGASSIILMLPTWRIILGLKCRPLKKRKVLIQGYFRQSNGHANG